MKLKPGEAQNSKFSDYERSSLISQITKEFFKFENRTEKILSFWGMIVQCTVADLLYCRGDRANFTQIHHQNFDISFLGVKLHYILGGIQMDLCL